MTKHLSPEILNKRRIKAVQRRLDGLTVVQVCEETELSAPTVSAAWKAFREGGWAGVPVQPRGRHKGQANVLAPELKATLWQSLYALPPDGEPGWNSATLARRLEDTYGQPVSQRAVEHWWEEAHLKHEAWPLESLSKERSARGRWYRQAVEPVYQPVRSAARRWQGGVRHLTLPEGGVFQVYLHGSRGRLWMRCFKRPPVAEAYLTMLKALASKGPSALVFHGAVFSAAPELGAWLGEQQDLSLVTVPADIGLMPGGTESSGLNNAFRRSGSNHSDSKSKQVKR